MKIWQIELTNECNFTCNYCPRTDNMKREIGTMSVPTIERIASICTSEWIRLHHYGESLLRPKLAVEAIKIFKAHNIRVGINSNGSATTLKNVLAVFEAGLDELVISWHPLNMRRDANEAPSDRHIQTLIDKLPKHYLDKIQVIRVVDEAEIPTAKAEMQPYKDQGLTCLIKRKRNLGQVNGEHTGETNTNCSFLTEPEFAVMWDGSIAVCCEVYDKGKGWTLGNVHDTTLPTKNPGCSLCKGCPGYGGNSLETEKVDF